MKRKAVISRRKPSQKRAETTLTSILQAAIGLLNDLGHEQIQKFNTNTVAERAGVSIGTLYQYFPNKDELLAEIFDYISNLDLGLVAHVAKTHPKAGMDQLLELMMRALIEKRYRKYEGLYSFIFLFRHQYARSETNKSVHEKIIRFIQSILDEKSSEPINFTHQRAFLMCRAFQDSCRSAFEFRPEFIRDPKFITLLIELVKAVPELSVKAS